MATLFSGIQPLYTTGSQQGGAAKYWTPQYGGIPTLPKYTTDTSQQIGPDVQAQMIANLPNYQAMLGQDVSNIQANLAGQVSPDVLAQIGQRAAERGIATGAPGSPNANAAYLRALGLNSQQLQQLGNQQLTAAMQRTPIQQTQLGTSTADLAAQQAVYNAAPDPTAAAREAMANARSGIGGGLGSMAGSQGFGARPTLTSSSDAEQAAIMSYLAPSLRSANEAIAAEEARSRAWQAANTGIDWTSPKTSQDFSMGYTAPYSYGQAPTLDTGYLGGTLTGDLLGTGDLMGGLGGLGYGYDEPSEDIWGSEESLMNWLGGGDMGEEVGTGPWVPSDFEAGEYYG